MLGNHDERETIQLAKAHETSVQSYEEKITRLKDELLLTNGDISTADIC